MTTQKYDTEYLDQGMSSLVDPTYDHHTDTVRFLASDEDWLVVPAATVARLGQQLADSDEATWGDVYGEWIAPT